MHNTPYIRIFYLCKKDIERIMKLRIRIYHLLVNRIPAIQKEYHKIRLEKTGMSGRIYAWIAIDVGWAGSGALALDTLVNKEWKLDCEIIGMIDGNNSVHNAEPNATESFLYSGRVVSYLYSQEHFYYPILLKGGACSVKGASTRSFEFS